ncbi:hypothetical protein sscle_08g067500 [Sclerotinia sclerotiorum 1980 UF-70]|uniref:F-box domain-containing protein n=1 Tax=Sclerotinia sclerotiorum (strain ATCC 18683 / 1980 / Ss-1) TaxID=665079 RepID=A0A1D9QAJ9_SCLS1|nr:hypothetical protein sscle_08g067500 [Sclerotinia sclerotiorum 1980 UF-70]
MLAGKSSNVYPSFDGKGQFSRIYGPLRSYMAANPHDVVGFYRMALESYHYAPRDRRNDQVVYMRKPCRTLPKSVYLNPTDPFSKLPLELRNMILFNLQAKDSVGLRYVSRGFRPTISTGLSTSDSQRDFHNFGKSINFNDEIGTSLKDARLESNI